LVPGLLGGGTARCFHLLGTFGWRLKLRRRPARSDAADRGRPRPAVHAANLDLPVQGGRRRRGPGLQPYLHRL